MTTVPDANERGLLACFADGSCETFSHADHVHVAWLLLGERELDDATDAFRQGAKALAASRGRPEMYHETITCAFMRLINQRMESQQRAANWPEFKAQNLDLLEADCGAIRKRYRPETLDSPKARLCDLVEDAETDA